jgi:DNA-binding transcriptional LysR family regulator
VERALNRLRIAFDAHLPAGRWGPLFHVLCLEQPDVQLEWHARGFPVGTLLEGADVGLFVHPPARAGLSALTVDAGPMVVAVAVGHRLAEHDELEVADVLDEAFPGASTVDQQWAAFWTLDRQRGAPARKSDDQIEDAGQGLEIVASGRAIATLPAWTAGGLTHAGVVTLPLRDGPIVETRLIWRSDDDNPTLAALVDLARHWTRERGTSSAGSDVGHIPRPRGPGRTRRRGR